MTHYVPVPLRACTPSRRLGGFSLTELLVVIVILGVLVAISVAALARATKVRSSARCAANLRAIGLAFQSYATDNDDHYPQTSTSGQWEDALRRYTPRSTFCCPADTELFANVGSSYDWRDSGDPLCSMAGRRTTEIVRDSISLSYDAMPGWHDVHKVQVVFTDASVHVLDEDAWLRELQAPVVAGP